MRVETYLILQGRKRWYQWSCRCVGVRKRKPYLKANQITIKVRVELPDDVFDEFIPQATVTVPAHLIVKPEIEVTAAKPDE